MNDGESIAGNQVSAKGVVIVNPFTFDTEPLW